MTEVRPFAFVLMPFDPAFDDVYRLGIKEPAEALGILAERVDEQLYKEGILDRIYNQIAAADMIVADMTGRNPNVFYEVGYAHAKEKLCILLTSNVEDIPFDLKHRRHIVYDDSILKLKRAINDEFLWAKREAENIREKRIQVKLKQCITDLESTSSMALGIIHFQIDLSNNSSQPSPEIQLGYFYSGEGWTLYQDDKECPSSESDVPGFEVRHFINVPVRRMGPKSWAQIRFTSKKYLARTWKGEEIEHSYRITGRSLLRLVTSDGDADYELPVDVIVDDIPF